MAPPLPAFALHPLPFLPLHPPTRPPSRPDLPPLKKKTTENLPQFLISFESPPTPLPKGPLFHPSSYALRTFVQGKSICRCVLETTDASKAIALLCIRTDINDEVPTSSKSGNIDDANCVTAKHCFLKSKEPYTPDIVITFRTYWRCFLRHWHKMLLEFNRALYIVHSLTHAMSSFLYHGILPYWYPFSASARVKL